MSATILTSAKFRARRAPQRLLPGAGFVLALLASSTLVWLPLLLWWWLA